MKVDLVYNTITANLDFSCSYPIIQKNLEQTVNQNKEKNITEWFSDFIQRIVQETNNEGFTLNIKGCDEYEKQFIEDFLKSFKDISISTTIENVSRNSLKYRYKTIEDFLTICKESEDVLVRKVVDMHQENIQVLKSNKVEIPVIATMSAGKSTLLNALIGQNLLPAKNEATTATTCEITVNNTLKAFVGKVFKENNPGINLDFTDNLSSKFIRDWNDQANEDSELRISIEGPIKNLKTHDFQLSFVDTPGPNNSQNEKHKNSIYTYLKDSKNLPILLFVLNAQQLRVNDEKVMLEEIKRHIDEKKESLDRILFVLNRVDELNVFDKEEPEPINDVINRIKKDLEVKFGIKNAKIFPISAIYAKLSQLTLDEDEDEYDKLNLLRKKIKPNSKRVGFELVENSSLTTKQKKYLNELAENSDFDADMVYSGLAGLKLYIEDYIENHHLKRQYKELYKITNQICKTIIANIEDQKEDLQSNLKEENKKKTANRDLEIRRIETRKKELFDKIKKNTFTEVPFASEERMIVNKKNEVYSKISYKSEFSPSEARSVLSQVNSILENAKISIRTSLVSKMNESVEKRVLELKRIAKDFFDEESDNIKVNRFNAEMVNSITTINPSKLSNYQRVKTTEKVRMEAKTFLGFKSFFGIVDYGQKEVKYYEHKDVVNLKGLYNSDIQPLFNQLSAVIRHYKNEFTKTIDVVDKEFMEKTTFFSEKLKKEVFENSDLLFIKDKKEVEDKLKKLQRIEQKINSEIEKIEL